MQLPDLSLFNVNGCLFLEWPMISLRRSPDSGYKLHKFHVSNLYRPSIPALTALISKSQPADLTFIRSNDGLPVGHCSLLEETIVLFERVEYSLPDARCRWDNTAKSNILKRYMKLHGNGCQKFVVRHIGCPGISYKIKTLPSL